MFLVLIFLILTSPLNAQEKSLKLFSPHVSVRTSKIDVPFDFFISIRAIEMENFGRLKYLRLEGSRERERAELYNGNDYQLHIFIDTYGSIELEDFRRDDRGLHNQSFSYLWNRVPFLSLGSNFLIDKRDDKFLMAVAKFQVDWFEVTHSISNGKSITDTEISWDYPFKHLWLFDVVLTIEGRLYRDSNFKSFSSGKGGLTFRVI